MKNIPKTRLAVAVAAALGASVPMQDAGAVNLATDGIGEIAIAPYYTTRDGWQTLVNLTNTTQHPVVVKLRVHEAWNSRDVFDISILMSAFDNFTALVTQDANDAPVFRVVDTDTCSAPLGTTQAAPGDTLSTRDWPLSPYAYGGVDPSTGVQADREWDGGPTESSRLREGYIEFLVQGHYTNDGGANDVVNLDDDEDGNGIKWDDSPGELIEAHACSALDTMFSTRERVLEAAQFAGEPINALKFNYRLINVNRGVEAGGSATTWANFFNPAKTAVGSPVDGVVRSGDGAGVVGNPGIYGILDDNAAGVPAAPTSECTITRGDERSQNGSSYGEIEWNPDDASATAGGTALEGVGSCLNLITAQTRFDFLEPSLNDAYPVRARGWVDRYNFAMRPANLDTDTGALVAEGRYGQGTPDADGLLPTTSSFPQDQGVAPHGSIRGIDAVSLTIQRSAVINEWASVPASADGIGVQTDWIINFPTKTFYVDQDPGVSGPWPVASTMSTVSGIGMQAGLIPGDRDEAYYTNGIYDDGDGEGVLGGPVGPPAVAVGDSRITNVPYAPFSQAFITTSSNSVVVNDTGSCVGVAYNAYNRAESTLGSGGGSIPSPAPALPGDDICYETNVLAFNTSGPLSSEVQTIVDTGDLGDNGWLHLSFTDDSAQAVDGTVQDATVGGLVGWSGLPTIGFVVKQRNVGYVGGNYASSMDHGFRRQCNTGTALFACPPVLDLDPD